MIYPGQMYGPGIGVQSATITSIEATIGHANANKSTNYANALRDWTANAANYIDCGMPVPPPPAKAALTKLTVVYADVNGTVLPAPTGLTDHLYAWVWEIPA